ncbi:MAG: SpoIID/LytB domain-containing protein, partial [Elusimicrobia bacterium]|nr:SpoIID/LytB domain-containing protein [Elusimicrobiota bacterium]
MTPAGRWGLALALLLCRPAGAADSEVDLAIRARDQGRAEEALAHWSKATLRPEARGFVWNQLGWACAALRRLPEARDSFLKGMDRSATTADRAESQLGLAVAARLEGQPRRALAPLRALLEQDPFDQASPLKSPFIMAAANHEAARAATSLGEKARAAAYLRQCLNLDALDLECLRDLAEAKAKAGDDREAWLAYRRLLSLDPGDRRAAREVEKLGAAVPEGLGVRRIGRPLLPPQPPEGEVRTESGPALRVALFTGRDGRAGKATRVRFAVNSDFKVLAAAGGAVLGEGRAQRRWEVDFRGEHGLLELRDESRNLVCTTTESFRIVPNGPAGSVLLQDAAFSERAAFDAGDRELRGAVSVRPGPGGFMLVNEVGLEEYLYGAVSAALPRQSDSEAYKAQAVVSRTRALWYRAHPGAGPDGADICDSEACQRYLGLSEEMQAAAAAVRETAGVTLTQDGAVALALEHDDCGGLTEDGRGAQAPGAEALVSVADGERPASVGRTPGELELWTHEYPPADSYCEASGINPPAESRWMRIIPAADIAERAGRSRDIGAVRQLVVRQRTATGRAQELEVV